MSKVLNPTKAQLVEKVDQVVSANEALIEDHVEFAGWVESKLGDISQAVMHALALAKGLGDGTGACGSCLASDLKSIVYALESADMAIDLVGEQSREIIDDFDPCIDDDESADDVLSMSIAEMMDGMSDEDLSRMQGKAERDDLPNVVASIQAEIERRAGLRN